MRIKNGVLRTAAELASTDKTSRNLCVIRLSEGKESSTILSTDGRRMVEFIVNHKDEPQEPHDVVSVDRDEMIAFCRTMSAKDSVNLTLNCKGVSFGGNRSFGRKKSKRSLSLVASGEIVEVDKYPDPRSVMPQNVATNDNDYVHISVNANYLIDACRAALAVSPDASKWSSIVLHIKKQDSKNQPMLFTASDPHGETTMTLAIMPIRMG